MAARSHPESGVLGAASSGCGGACLHPSVPRQTGPPPGPVTSLWQQPHKSHVSVGPPPGFPGAHHRHRLLPLQLGVPPGLRTPWPWVLEGVWARPMALLLSHCLGIDAPRYGPPH